jgi:xanthine dehydrogenase accessory factor
MSRFDLIQRAANLREHDVPFVMATVVRVEHPSSARPGDTALVFADGTIEGFAGGSCAQATLKVESLRALESGESTYLIICPDGSSLQPAKEGVVSVSNPCASGGTVELFLEPELPPPRVVVIGTSPIAESVRNVGKALGYRILDQHALTDDTQSVDAAILATHGLEDEHVHLSRAIERGISYVGLVASPTRGSAVRHMLSLDPSAAARLHTPAGLDLGSTTPAEIALSIYAEIVSLKLKSPQRDTFRPTLHEDPVCHMEVLESPQAITTQIDGIVYYFCAPGCRTSFLSDPDKFLATSGR